MDKLEELVFAAGVREAFMEIAQSAWDGGRLGLTQDATLLVLMPQMEPIVQAIVRKVGQQ